MPPQPVLKDFHNIECRDAVLAYDRMEYVTDKRGVPVSRWDGKTMKKHSVTGEDVPDETARVPLERYVNPHKAEWPKADFVVGNPPFIGNKRMRAALGDGYVGALRSSCPDVPESADFVMYWWDRAAELTRHGQLRRFGLITTNSLRQTHNRAVIERHSSNEPSVSLSFAIPDHPWVDSVDGAAVRIAMSVGTIGKHLGELATVEAEESRDDGEVAVVLRRLRGHIGKDLRIGASVPDAEPLLANRGLCWQGCKLVGGGFQVTPEQAFEWIATDASSAKLLPRYWAGSDITKTRTERHVIDTFGWELEKLRQEHPYLYQHLYDRVFPERAQNRDKGFRTRWWLFGRPRPDLREALFGLRRYVATSEVSKHRFFVFLDWPKDLVDGSIAALALDDSTRLGTVSSYPHLCWALAAGGTLENRPRYQNGPCFDNFPFPIASVQDARIGSIAEQLDAHRKRQQAQHPELTLTGMYNVLEKLKSGKALNAKEKIIHEQGLVSVLKQLHDELDLAVLEVYGWSDLARLMQVVNGNASLPHPNPLPGGEGAMMTTREEAKRALDDALLERLVALNAERAAEEKKGLIRWLRPEFQNPEKKAAAPKQSEMEIEDEAETKPATKAGKVPWPKDLPDQVRQVADVLATAREPMSLDAIAERFTGKGPWKRRLPQIVETLESLGRARRVGDKLLGLN